MAHFAQIDPNNNNIVLQVLVVPDDQEHRGQDFLANDLGLGGTWIQTSYNTRGGKHYTRVPVVSADATVGWTLSADGLSGTRYNYATVGGVYDYKRDAFIPPCIYTTWVLDETTCLWQCPVPAPSGRIPGYKSLWNDYTRSWTQVPLVGPYDPSLSATTVPIDLTKYNYTTDASGNVVS